MYDLIIFVIIRFQCKLFLSGNVSFLYFLIFENVIAFEGYIFQRNEWKSDRVWWS